MTKQIFHPRLKQIDRYISEHRQVSTSLLCMTFDISEATARRDLDQLAALGSVMRIHGGAVAVSAAPPEPPVLQRSLRQQHEKQRIAQAAANLIDAGDTVFISSGTTALAVAQIIRNRSDITVVTNSLPVLNCLADSNLDVIALGGMFRQSESSFIGHLAVQSLAELRMTKIIFGIRGIDVMQGLTNDYLPETMTDRAILSAGKHVIIVADHTKLGRSAPAFVAPLSAIDTLVTDSNADSTLCHAIATIGVRVIQA
ncbi:MAG: DeoR/GlpR family DNA-binding transcription regulator [Chloroflexales bacterium]|nr:DeoR/GlpR family DNA-binding transcription regulator [Chloroflexales bacterium]